MNTPDLAPRPPGWRFAQGETRRLDLSEGDWLLVKKRLSAGERRAAFQRTVVTAPDGTRSPAPGMLGHAKCLAYLLDWSITDPMGRQVVIREGFTMEGQDRLAVLSSALDQLDAEYFDEIADAITAHELQMIAERAEEKKTRTGARASSPTSASPAPTGGNSSGSATSTPMSMTSS
jgi:hypothetical protein